MNVSVICSLVMVMELILGKQKGIQQRLGGVKVPAMDPANLIKGKNLVRILCGAPLIFQMVGREDFMQAAASGSLRGMVLLFLVATRRL